MDRVEMYIEQATHLRIQRDALAIENAELHRRLNDALVGDENEHLRRLNQQLADKLAELRRQLGEADEAAEEYAVEGDQYRHRLMAAEAAIETLHSQLDEAQRWEPVEDGPVEVLDSSDAGLVVDGAWLWVQQGGDDLISVILPDHVRLCHLVEGQPATE